MSDFGVPDWTSDFDVDPESLPFETPDHKKVKKVTLRDDTGGTRTVFVEQGLDPKLIPPPGGKEGEPSDDLGDGAKPYPTIEDKVREQDSFWDKLKTMGRAGLDPVGIVEPNWQEKAVSAVAGEASPDDPWYESAGRSLAEQAVGMAASPLTAAFAVPGVATSIPGRLAAGYFGVEAAKGGGEQLGHVQSLVEDQGKSWSDPEVVKSLTGGVTNLAMAPGALYGAVHGAPVEAAKTWEKTRLNPFLEEKVLPPVRGLAERLGYQERPLPSESYVVDPREAPVAPIVEARPKPQGFSTPEEEGAYLTDILNSDASAEKKMMAQLRLEEILNPEMPDAAGVDRLNMMDAEAIAQEEAANTVRPANVSPAPEAPRPEPTRVAPSTDVVGAKGEGVVDANVGLNDVIDTLVGKGNRPKAAQLREAREVWTQLIGEAKGDTPRASELAALLERRKGGAPAPEPAKVPEGKAAPEASPTTPDNQAVLEDLQNQIKRAKVQGRWSEVERLQAELAKAQPAPEAPSGKTGVQAESPVQSVPVGGGKTAGEVRPQEATTGPTGETVPAPKVEGGPKKLADMTPEELEAEATLAEQQKKYTSADTLRTLAEKKRGEAARAAQIEETRKKSAQSTIAAVEEVERSTTKLGTPEDFEAYKQSMSDTVDRWKKIGYDSGTIERMLGHLYDKWVKTPGAGSGGKFLPFEWEKEAGAGQPPSAGSGEKPPTVESAPATPERRDLEHRPTDTHLQDLAKNHPLVKMFREGDTHLIDLWDRKEDVTPTEARFLLNEEPGLAKWDWIKNKAGEQTPTPVEAGKPAGEVSPVVSENPLEGKIPKNKRPKRVNPVKVLTGEVKETPPVEPVTKTPSQKAAADVDTVSERVESETGQSVNKPPADLSTPEGKKFVESVAKNMGVTPEKAASLVSKPPTGGTVQKGSIPQGGAKAGAAPVKTVPAASKTVRGPSGGPPQGPTAPPAPPTPRLPRPKGKRPVLDMLEWMRQRRSGDVLKERTRRSFESLPKGVQAQLDFEAGNLKLPEVRQFLDSQHRLLRKAGVDVGYVENYLTHLWKDNPKKVQQVLGRHLGLKPGIAMTRSIPTLAEGIKKGLTPKFENMSDVLSWYAQSVNKAIADRGFFEYLREQKQIRPHGKAPRDWVTLNPDRFPIKKWKGNTVQFKAPPEVAAKINEYLKDLRADPTWFTKGLMKTARFSSFLKNIRLAAGVPFTKLNMHGWSVTAHHVLSTPTIKGVIPNIPRMIGRGLKDIGEMMDPRLHRWTDQELTRANLMQKYGPLTLSTEDHVFAPAVKGSLMSRLKDAKSIPSAFKTVIDRMFEEPLFQSHLPKMKLNVAWEMQRQFRKEGMSRRAAIEAAGEVTNNLFGGLNLDEMGRSKMGQEMARVVALAPDWLEANLRTVKGMSTSFLGKTPKEKVYRDFTINLLGTYVSATILQKALTGRFMHENNPGNQFSIYLGKNPDNGKDRYVKPYGAGLAGVRLIYDAADSVARRQDFTTIFRSALNRASIPASTVGSLSYNQGPFGDKVYKQGDTLGGQAADIGEYAVGQAVPQYVLGPVQAVQGKISPEYGLAQTMEFPYTEVKHRDPWEAVPSRSRRRSRGRGRR